jgi:hypothetical protein
MAIGCLALSLSLAASGADATNASKADAQLAAKIQKSVAKDSSLPNSSRDVQVTVENRVVTIRGTVTSDAESQAIQAKAESLVIQDTHHQTAAETPRFDIDNKLVVTSR